MAALHLGKKGHEIHLYEYREGKWVVPLWRHKKKHFPNVTLRNELLLYIYKYVTYVYNGEFISLDIRKAQLAKGRSINLSLSARGRVALAEVGLEEELLQHGIPMYGRMLHDLNGNMTFVPYDRNTKQVQFFSLTHPHGLLGGCIHILSGSLSVVYCTTK